MQSENETSIPYVTTRRSGSVLWLTLNQPEQRNALSGAMIDAIHLHIREANADSSVSVIVIAAKGPVFSAGHDLNEMRRRESETKEEQKQRVEKILDKCNQFMLSIQNSPKVFMACVQGVATAAGCQLVSFCDLALASEDAQFCTPGVNIGSFCTTPLVGIGRNISRKHAMELALTGDLYNAEDAVRFGLINKVVPTDKLEQETEALAQKIASKTTTGIGLGKQAFYKQIEMPLHEAFHFAAERMLEAMTSEDSEEGIAAFFEKRAPNWDKKS